MGAGLPELAERVLSLEASVIAIDGYGGVLWARFKDQLATEIEKINAKTGGDKKKAVQWVCIDEALKSERYFSFYHFLFFSFLSSFLFP